MATVKKATKPKPKSVRKPMVPAPDVAPPQVTPAPTSESNTRLNTNGLVDAICGRIGYKRKDVKPVVEAALAEMGEALQRGEQLQLQPLGKIVVKRKKDVGNARVFSCKIRINNSE